jgi:hypothetical protein
MTQVSVENTPISVALNDESFTVSSNNVLRVTITVSRNDVVSINGAEVSSGSDEDTAVIETVIVDGDTVSTPNEAHIGGFVVS